MYTDAHIHLFDLFNASGTLPSLGNDHIVCASSHTKEEFLWQEAFALTIPGQVFLSFGIHPQEPRHTEIDFLGALVKAKRINAIGECGFDLFDENFQRTEQEQLALWNIQLDLAIEGGLPLVIHCRKALHYVFADTRKLQKVRAVVFHGWPGSASEAQSVLKRGINAYFSVGKGLLRKDRSLRETVALLPVSRLLTETDAPFMTSKGETFTLPNAIIIVAAEAANLSGTELSLFLESVNHTFKSVFGASSESR